VKSQFPFNEDTIKPNCFESFSALFFKSNLGNRQLDSFGPLSRHALITGMIGVVKLNFEI